MPAIIRIKGADSWTCPIPTVTGRIGPTGPTGPIGPSNTTGPKGAAAALTLYRKRYADKAFEYAYDDIKFKTVRATTTTWGSTLFANTLSGYDIFGGGIRITGSIRYLIQFDTSAGSTVNGTLTIDKTFTDMSEQYLELYRGNFGLSTIGDARILLNLGGNRIEPHGDSSRYYNFSPYYGNIWPSPSSSRTGLNVSQITGLSDVSPVLGNAERIVTSGGTADAFCALIDQLKGVGKITNIQASLLKLNFRRSGA